MALGELNVVNLASVTANTDGDWIDVRHVEKKTVFVEVSGGGEDGVVTIESSPDGETAYELDSKTYAAAAKDSWSYSSHISFIRTTLTARGGGTFKTTITGRDPSAA